MNSQELAVKWLAAREMRREAARHENDMYCALVKALMKEGMSTVGSRRAVKAIKEAAQTRFLGLVICNPRRGILFGLAYAYRVVKNNTAIEIWE